jgi:hypothetical protein
MSRREALRGILWVLLAALVGWLVPMGTRFGSERFYTAASLAAILGRMREEMFREGDQLFLVGALNAIPFAVGIALAEGTRALARRLRPAMEWLRWGDLVLLGGITAATSLAVWNNLYGPGKVSSTAAIAFVVVPVYATGVAIAAYLLTMGIVAARSFRGRAER